MAKLTSSIDIHTAEFQANAQAMAELVRDLTDKRAAIAEGGPAKARERHQSRGKLLARERVNAAPRSRQPLPRARAAGGVRHV